MDRGKKAVDWAGKGEENRENREGEETRDTKERDLCAETEPLERADV